MAKPIAVVYLPESIHPSGMRLSQTAMYDMCTCLQKDYPDYYWFVLSDYNAPRVELKVFHEKDFTEIQYKELLQLVKEKLNDTNQTR